MTLPDWQHCSPSRDVDGAPDAGSRHQAERLLWKERMSIFTCATLAPRKLLHSVLCLGVLGTTVPATAAEVSKDFLFFRSFVDLPAIDRSLPPPIGRDNTFVTSARIEPLNWPGLVEASLTTSFADQVPLAAAANAAFGLTATLKGGGFFSSTAIASVKSTVRLPGTVDRQPLSPIYVRSENSTATALQFGAQTEKAVSTTSSETTSSFVDDPTLTFRRKYTQSFTVTQTSQVRLDQILAEVVATHQTSGATARGTLLLTGGLQGLQLDLSRSGLWNLALSEVKLFGAYSDRFSMTVTETTLALERACIFLVVCDIYGEISKRTSAVDFGAEGSFEFSIPGFNRDARLGSLMVGPDITTVPLPSGLPLGIAGLAALLAVARRRRGT